MANNNMGGGFIEFLFGDAPQGGRYQQPMYQQQPDVGFDGRRMPGSPQGYGQEAAEPTQRSFDPKYNKQVVDYHGNEGAGTVVIDTPNKFLYLVQGDGKALRYGVGVGRPGFTWSGTKSITAKKEWPAWTPPPEMLARRHDLPRHMEGGPENPLGARAMYLGSTLYRIHGSNEPWTIGTNVSSGCIRMRNEDVIDLYGRVNVGTRVVVM
jgi:lipoprotein-anchoring transpeptidase ErfK/SrfK